MAQKAAKALAARNAATLKNFRIAFLIVHGIFALLRFVVFRGSLSRNTYILYIALSAPSVAIQLFLESNSRPKYDKNGELVTAGHDLGLRGITEYLLDVMYWSWGTIVIAAIFGDRGWWMFAAVPVYSLYAAWKAFTGVKETISGFGGGSGTDEGGQSKRQQKLEKRGQRMQYR